jgi:L-iditol 2-dehydrogenase
VYAAIVDDQYQLTMAEVPAPALPPAGALVQLHGCGLCGSDLDKIINRKAAPGAILGHEVVGTIVALGDGHGTAFQVGDRVVAAHHVPCGRCHYCLSRTESMCRQFKATNLDPGGFAQTLALSREHLHHTTFSIPAAVSDPAASCVEPLACVLKAVHRTEPLICYPGVTPTVGVIGLGFIGLMAAQAYQQSGARVIGADINPDRLALARQEGWVEAAFHATDQAEAALAYLAEQTAVGKADLVFLSTVNTATLAQALGWVRDGGTLVLFTSPSKAETVLDPGLLYFREITVVPSYSPSLASLRQAAHWIFNGTLRVEPMLSHTVDLADVQRGVSLYRSGEAMKVYIRMQPAEDLTHDA